MNARQVAKQLKQILAGLEWTTDVPVFGTVEVASAPEERIATGLRLPAALVRVGASTPDDEIPQLVTHAFDLVVVVQCEADAWGAGALFGHGRDSVTSGTGRGLLEIEEEVLGALGRALRMDGVSLAGWTADEAEVAEIAGALLTARTYRLQVRGTAEATYHPARDLAGTDQGGGVVALSWRWPPDRWDALQLVLRRASGSTPPASVSAGTAVATYTSRSDTSDTDDPGVGTWSYALFAQYDDLEGGDATDTAAAATATVTLA